MKVNCPTCGANLTLGEKLGIKLSLAATGAIVGSRVHWLAALLAAGVGYWIGENYIDPEIYKTVQTCPQCRQLFTIANNVL